MVTAITATTALCLPIDTALAVPRHVGRTGHTRLVRVTSVPTRRVMHRHHRWVPVHSDVHHTEIMHRNVVPLANVVWDNPSVTPAVLNALQMASQSTGVDQGLLSAIAWRESRFDPAARNRQSSATGLLQFTSETWLRAVRDFGPNHGLVSFAAAIHRNPSGTFTVSEGRMRTAIMRLRSDPVLSASFAAESIVRQRDALQDQLGRPVTPADLYLLHVLGPRGAVRFIRAVAENPSESSLHVASFKVMRNAGLLPRDGRPLTLANTYGAVTVLLQTRHETLSPKTESAGSEVSMAEPVEVSAMPLWQ